MQPLSHGEGLIIPEEVPNIVCRQLLFLPVDLVFWAGRMPPKKNPAPATPEDGEEDDFESFDYDILIPDSIQGKDRALLAVSRVDCNGMLSLYWRFVDRCSLR